MFLADDTQLGRKVAIKFLTEALEADTTARERLRREARSAAGLDHPFICKIHEIAEVDGRTGIVMEHVAGETLQTTLARGQVSPRRALEIATEIAEALDEAHTQRLVHRDLKPANVMLTAQGHVKVMDFGLAKAVESTSGPLDNAETVAQITESGVRVGTPGYMAPEQLLGGHAVGHLRVRYRGVRVAHRRASVPPRQPERHDGGDPARRAGPGHPVSGSAAGLGEGGARPDAGEGPWAAASVVRRRARRPETAARRCLRGLRGHSGGHARPNAGGGRDTRRHTNPLRWPRDGTRRDPSSARPGGGGTRRDGAGGRRAGRREDPVHRGVAARSARARLSDAGRALLRHRRHPAVHPVRRDPRTLGQDRRPGGTARSPGRHGARGGEDRARAAACLPRHPGRGRAAAGPAAAVPVQRVSSVHRAVGPADADRPRARRPALGRRTDPAADAASGATGSTTAPAHRRHLP